MVAVVVVSNLVDLGRSRGCREGRQGQEDRQGQEGQQGHSAFGPRQRRLP